VSHDILRGALAIGALACGLPLAACGDFSADEPAQGGTGGMVPAAGSPGAGSPGASGSGGAPVGGGGAGSTAGAAPMAGAGGRPAPPEPTCTDVAACGGDVTGVWFATGSCLPLTGMAEIGAFGLGCKQVAAEGKIEVTGNWTLNADGTMSDNTSMTGMVKMELEKECLNISGTVTQCDRVPAQLGSIGIKDPVCVDSTVTTGGCTCNGTIEQMGSLGHLTFDPYKMGKYTTASNKLTTMGIDNIEYDYCVQGEGMLVTPKVGKEIGVLNGTVAFVKQP
jgi:hypothetical protein